MTREEFLCLLKTEILPSLTELQLPDKAGNWMFYKSGCYCEYSGNEVNTKGQQGFEAAIWYNYMLDQIKEEDLYAIQSDFSFCMAPVLITLGFKWDRDDLGQETWTHQNGLEYFFSPYSSQWENDTETVRRAQLELYATFCK